MRQFILEGLGADDVMFAFGWIPVLVYVNGRSDRAGSASMFLLLTWINVKPQHFQDRGLLLHELEHCEDYYRYGGIGYVLLRKFSAKWRLFFEMKAYTRQFMEYANNSPARVSTDRIFNKLVDFMTFNYDTKQTRHEIVVKFRNAILATTE